MKKIIFAAAALLMILCLSLTACKSMTNTGRINNDRITGETTTQSKLKKDAEKIKDDIGDAASDAGEKVSEKLSEAGSTVREGLENAKEDISDMTNGRR